MRGLRARIAAWIIGAGLLGALAACPPAPKPPVGPMPDASDAAQTPPSAPDCTTACGHYNAVCAASFAVCSRTCPGAQDVDPGYSACVAGATTCMNCDATARAAAKAAGK